MATINRRIGIQSVNGKDLEVFAKIENGLEKYKFFREVNEAGEEVESRLPVDGAYLEAHCRGDYEKGTLKIVQESASFVPCNDGKDYMGYHVTTNQKGKKTHLVRLWRNVRELNDKGQCAFDWASKMNLTEDEMFSLCDLLNDACDKLSAATPVAEAKAA